jgi:Mpv17 / PMP22 family
MSGPILVAIITVLALLPTSHAFVGPVVTPLPSLSHTSTTSTCTSTTSSVPIPLCTWHKKRTCTQLAPSLLTEAVSQYQVLLSECPLPTQCVTSSILAGFGDGLAQIQQLELENKYKCKHNYLMSIKQLKLDRLLKFMIKGFGGGIIWALWFAVNEQWTTQIMDTILYSATGPVNAVVTMAKTVVSILLEQFIAVPIIYTFWDIPLPILLSSTRNNRSIPLQIQKTLPGLLWDNAKVWTFANVLVYTAPLEYRVLVSSLVDVAWQSIVSSHVMTTKDPETAPSPTMIAEQDNVLLESILPRQPSQQPERNPNFRGKDRQPQTADVLP